MWLKKIWRIALSLLLNNRGFAEEGEEGQEGKEGEEGQEGSGDNADKGKEGSEGTGAGEGGEGQEEGEEGSGEEGEEGQEGKEGQEGADKPDEELGKMFGKDFGKLGKAYRELQSTSKPKEMNLAAMTKWFSNMGLKPRYDGQGSFVKFEMDKKPEATERKRRFTDEHRKGLAKFFNNEEGSNKFVETISLLAQDLVDDGIAGREKVANEAISHRRQEIACEKFIAKIYPDADPDKEGFPVGGTPLYKRAVAIYETNEDYQQHPRGQLFATHEAALELGIQPQAVAAAKAAGKKEGTENKRILSRVGAGQGGGKGKIKLPEGEVSMVDFMTMTPKQREKYQQEQLSKKT